MCPMKTTSRLWLELTSKGYYGLVMTNPEESRNQIFVTHNLGGHWSTWFQAFSEHHQIEIFSQNSALTRISKSQLKEYELNPNIHFQLAGNSKWATIQSARKYRRSVGGKHAIIFPDGDKWFQYSILVPNARVFFLRFHIDALNPLGFVRYLAKYLFILASYFNPSIKVGILNIPFNQRKVFKSLWFDDKSFCTSNPDSAQKDLERTKLDVLIPGFITERKSLDLVFEKLSLFGAIQRNLRLTILGQLEAKIPNEYSNFSLQVKSGYQTRTDYESEIKNADLVLAIYQNRGSSGVVLDCLHLGTPVLITNGKRWQGLKEHFPNLLVTLDSKEDNLLESLIDFQQGNNLVERSLQRDLAVNSFLRFFGLEED